MTERKVSKFWAYFLNIMFLPLGFYYIKDQRRFILYTIVSLLLLIVFSLLAWVLTFVISGSTHFFFLIFAFMLFWAWLVFETYRSLKENKISAHKLFYKPAAYWFVPVYIIVSIVLTIVLEPIEKPFINAHNVPSGSMEPSVQQGDFVFVNYILNEVKRGDIIAFDATTESLQGKTLIKRIIAIPGDRIEINKNRISINGKELGRKPYEKPVSSLMIGKTFHNKDENEYEAFTETNNGHSYQVLQMKSSIFGAEPVELTLAADEYYLMGDNRDNSQDSRFFGPVKREFLRGKYVYTYFSIDWHDELCSQPVNVSSPAMKLVQYWSGMCPKAEVRWQNFGRVAP